MSILAILLTHLGLTAAVAAGEAVPECRVALEPADASGPWVSAAASLQRTLGAGAAPDRDCREVVIHADPAHASVEVTTRDGRHGVRALNDPGDVEPTVTALIVTVPEGAIVERDEPDRARPADRHILLVAAGGAKLTLPNTPASMVSVAAGMISGPWELTVYGSWTPSVLGASATANAPYSSTKEIELGLARRQPIHSGALLFGVRAGVVQIASNDTGTGNTGGVDGNAPTISAFAGAALPLFSFLRLRPELLVQCIPLLWSSSDEKSLWSLGFSLGAESSLL